MLAQISAFTLGSMPPFCPAGPPVASGAAPRQKKPPTARDGDRQHMDAKQLTEGQRAYEAKRAAKAGMTLEKWLVEKERRAKAEAEAAVVKTEAPKKPGFFARLLEKAQKPL